MLHVIALIIIVVMMAAVKSYNVYAQAPPPSSGASQLENKTLTNSTNNTNITVPSSGIYQLIKCVQGNSSYAMFKSCLASLNRLHISPPPPETDNSSRSLPTPPSSGLSRLEGNLTNQTAPHSEKSKLK
jgi:hypothetical protein